MATRSHTSKQKNNSVIWGVFSVVVAFGLPFVAVWQWQSLLDWWHLRDYTPTAQITTIGNEAAFTDKSRKLFYVNHPQLLTGQDFTKNCTIGAEKTVILGCYISGDRGIYLYNVADQRLNGVVQTTAAHEMLHAAYARLSGQEKQRIDGLLESFYKTGVTDERIKETMAAYQKSEPNDIANEMHSIFATEIVTLPSELETYYKQYFTDRASVVRMAQKYQAEFTTRRDQTKAFDDQLTAMKTEIDQNQARLSSQKRAIDSDYSRLTSLRRSQQVDTYNRLVEDYNAAVSSYNSLLESTRQLILRYNNVVEQRNAVALEEQSLVKALTSETIEQ